MYYVITSAQAAEAQKFILKKGYAFDPFVGEQTNGRFLVEVALVQKYMDNPKESGIDWSKIPTITHAQALANLKPFVRG